MLAQDAELAIRQRVECISAELIEQVAAFGTYKYAVAAQELKSA